MSKPDLIKWVTDDSSSKISDPGSTKKLAGFLYKEKVAFQFLNWMWNRVSKWLLGLQGEYYDIVIGSATQVTNNEATHDITDLDDTLAVAGSRVLILDGTHTLTGNLSLTNDDLKVVSESPLAILDVDTYTATFSGARDWLRLRVINAGAGDIIVSGAGSIFEGINVPLANVTVSNGAVARNSGVSGGLNYPALQVAGSDVLDRGTVQTYTSQKNFAIATLTDAANISWNMNNQQVAKVTLGGNRTLDNPTNVVEGGTYQLTVYQDGTGSRTLSYGANIIWPNGVAPTLATGPGDATVLTFTGGASNELFGVGVGPFAS